MTMLIMLESEMQNIKEISARVSIISECHCLTKQGLQRPFIIIPNGLLDY
jgi:hypothetical protein